MVDAALTAQFRGVPHALHPSGCTMGCRHVHLLPDTLVRLVTSGIPVQMVREAVEDESRAHATDPLGEGLTPQGARNLAAWGATPDQIKSASMAGGQGGSRGSEPVGNTPGRPPIPFRERERSRVAEYRAGLDDDERKRLAREASRRYRERQREREHE